MRMEPLLLADENAPEWAFSKRKGVNDIALFHAHRLNHYFLHGIFARLLFAHQSIHLVFVFFYGVIWLNRRYIRTQIRVNFVCHINSQIIHQMIIYDLMHLQ
jgi:hypothetical protein